MEYKDLKQKMFEAKKSGDKELSRAYEAVINKADSIAKKAKREADSSDVIAGAKSELKEIAQSKEAGAPFSKKAKEICESIMPKTKSDQETKKIVEDIVSEMPEKSMKMMGQVMGKISKDWGQAVDKTKASKFAKEILGS